MSSNTVPRGDSVSFQSDEDELAKRYLHIIERWIPVGVKYFEEWPDRPNCGHFLGGCHWYGIETISGALTFATAAAAPSYDEEYTGISRDELRSMALQGLRYLCFTHDTGPEECVRPSEGLGRSENFGTKWGERGKGFFRESQCGSTVAGMAITAQLLGDLVDEETWEMLETIHLDYADRFGEMDPKSGVYWDTQMEENAWTSFGLSSVISFLANHSDIETWEETTHRWMFSTAATPQDAHDDRPITSEDSVSDLVNRTYTTLSDYMAENHGMVHPSYTASSITYLGRLGVLFGVFDGETPSHAYHNRELIYEQLKYMTDSTGSMHPVQGMDWPYLRVDPGTGTHAAAALMLDDPDAARLERWSLETFEARQDGNDGYLYDPELANQLHGPQDPLIIRESGISSAAYGYLLHRCFGPGPEPTPANELDETLKGTKTYPHAGFVFNRHEQGQTSFAWRNSLMALPLNSDGIYTVAPAIDSYLARIEVEDRGDCHDLLANDVDRHENAFAAFLVAERNEGTIRQETLFASLPNGTSISLERLTALEAITVTSVEQGFIRVINEEFPSFEGNCQGERTVHTPEDTQVFESYIADDPDEDIVETYNDPAWINIDDRIGVIPRASGSTVYHNRHYFDPWRAVADDLILSCGDSSRDLRAGESIGELSALVAPDQPHQQTREQAFTVLDSPEATAGLMADEHLAVANFSSTTGKKRFDVDRDEVHDVPVFPGQATVQPGQISYHTRLGPHECELYQAVESLETDGALEITASESSVAITCTGPASASVEASRSGTSLTLEPGESKVLKFH